jgi:hypothetical protein
MTRLADRREPPLRCAWAIGWAAVALASCSLLAASEDDLSREYSGATGSAGHGGEPDAGADAAGGGGGCPQGHVDLDGESANGCEHASEIPTAGLLLWLRGGEGLDVADGGVLGWRDVSGSALHAEQGFGARRPALVADGLNAMPVLAFDGIDDELILPEGIAGLDQGVSIFVVVSPEPKGWSTVLNFGYESGSLPNLWLGRYDTFDEVVYGLGSGCAGTCGLISEGTAYPAGFHLVSVIHDVSSAVLRVDRSVRSAPGVRVVMPAGAPRDHNQIGNNQDSDGVQFHGQLAEVIVYRGAADVDAVEGYLASKWSCCP